MNKIAVLGKTKKRKKEIE